jgi:glucan biosynthesis protein C
VTTQTIRVQRANAQLSASEVRLSGRPRLLYIDNLRTLLTILVILGHLAIGYGGPGDWYYNEEGELGTAAAIVMTLLIAISQSFFMGLFFMISGYFSPASFDRRGARPYLRDRLKRLGIPLLFYTVVSQPLLVYALRVHHGLQEAFWRFPTLFSEYLNSLGVGPLWFVETLLIFSFIYALWRLLTKPAPAPSQSDGQAPGNAAIALFGVALGLASFVVRIWVPVGWWFEPLHLQLAHFPQYIALFMVGIVAYRRNWLAGISDAQGRIWLWIALVLIALFPVVLVAGGALEGDLTPGLGGLHWQSLFYCVWEQLMCMAMVVTLLVWFRNRFDQQGRVARAMSAAAYAVYVFHAPVIVLLALAVSGMRLDLALKFVLVAPVAVCLCFLVGHYVRKLPLARSIL